MEIFEKSETGHFGNLPNVELLLISIECDELRPQVMESYSGTRLRRVRFNHFDRKERSTSTSFASFSSFCGPWDCTALLCSRKCRALLIDFPQFHQKALRPSSERNRWHLHVAIDCRSYAVDWCTLKRREIFPCVATPETLISRAPCIDSFIIKTFI